MKRFTFILSFFVAVVFSMLFVSCGSDDENDNFIENATFDTSLLYGGWEVTHWGTKTPAYWDSMNDTKLYFYEDGTFRTSGGSFGSQKTTYTIKGNTITLNPSVSSDNAYIIIQVQSISSDEAVFFATFHTDEGTETICAQCDKI